MPIRPYNAQMSENGAWWVPLIEKAFAKFFNMYLNMHGGYARVALRALTGMPVINMKTDNMEIDEIWEKLSEADENHYVMTAGCDTPKDGLVSGHIYTILGVDEASHMITLRNPWSNELYYGEGSDQDDDGTFRVPVDIFKYAFGEFTILYYKDWKTSTIGKQVVDKDEAVYGSQKKQFYIYNPVEQTAMVTLDIVDDILGLPDCSIEDSNIRVKIT